MAGGDSTRGVLRVPDRLGPGRAWVALLDRLDARLYPRHWPPGKHVGGLDAAAATAAGGGGA